MSGRPLILITDSRPFIFCNSYSLDIDSTSHSKLESRKRRRIEFNPHVFALAVSSDDGFPQNRSLEVLGRHAIDDLKIVGDYGFLDL
nr:hypothetical protein Iba_chr06fCG8540 [Ipomoea batatas]